MRCLLTWGGLGDGWSGAARRALAEHLAGLAVQRGARVLWGRCWELLARLSLELTFSDETEVMEPLSPGCGRHGPSAGRPGGAARRAPLQVDGGVGSGRLEERTALAEEALRLARETGDREMELDGHARQAASSGRRPGSPGRHRRPRPAGRGAAHRRPRVGSHDNASPGCRQGRLPGPAGRAWGGAGGGGGVRRPRPCRQGTRGAGLPGGSWRGRWGWAAAAAGRPPMPSAPG